MLDAAIKEQLKEVFSKLTAVVTLRVSNSAHHEQQNLLTMLTEVASASEKIKIEIINKWNSEYPRFEIHGSKTHGKIRFHGIPGGMEFTSLVLAILHSDGKAKQPDSFTANRISGLKGPIRLKTYVSLECENCPDVVQNLNLMAAIHPDFTHETIDGAIAQNEIKELGIQGVPCVVHEGRILHAGKTRLIDLLSLLEETFGKTSNNAIETNLGKFDVAIVGGGPAGVSSAIYSARKGFKTVIIAEQVGGQLNDTTGIENMISIPYIEGAGLASQLMKHAAHYPITILENKRVKEITKEKQIKVILDDGQTIESKNVLIATGAKWRRLGVPGEKEHIGRGVSFCAHCDGPFYKGKKVVVIGGGNSGVEAAIDLSALVREVILIEATDKLKADETLLQKLRATPNATVILNTIATEISGNGKFVTGLKTENRITKEKRAIDADGVFVQIGLAPNSDFVKNLLKLTPTGEIIVDARGRTSIPGIYAAGDVTTTPFKQIITAMGDGAKTALAIFEDTLLTPVSPSS